MTNAELITSFYTAFANKDYRTMQQCYADDAVFQDEVFGPLNAAETRAMWELLCRNAKEFSLTFSDVNADEKTGAANWEAQYVFSATGNRVVNRIQASFTFENGKIKSHRDRFDFHEWSAQALGWKGKLLGWSEWLRKKVSAGAMLNLKKFMSR